MGTTYWVKKKIVIIWIHTFVYVFVNCMYVSSICVSILIHGNVCAEVSRKYKLLLTVSRTNLFEESSIFIISLFNCDQWFMQDDLIQWKIMCTFLPFFNYDTCNNGNQQNNDINEIFNDVFLKHWYSCFKLELSLFTLFQFSWNSLNQKLVLKVSIKLDDFD